jgi:hypothetical protein
VISIRRHERAEIALDRTLHRARVTAADLLVDGDRLVAVTRTAPWRRIDLAARVLESARLAPVVSRCEVRV